MASLRAFEAGLFSSRPEEPLRADGEALIHLDAEALARAFQVSSDNALVGLEGRAALLRRLGACLHDRPDLFGKDGAGRPGGLFDALSSRASNGALPAPRILEALLDGLGPVWANRPILAGLPLGDCWAHPELGWVPLHKLSQWLSYSLIEPLEDAGLRIADIDGLTGLAEYRNGGLFMDMGVLRLRDPEAAALAHRVDAPLVVGWRSMTVALLDAIAPLVRHRLHLNEMDFPLARVLEGGTWAAGRRIAKNLRTDGGPPLIILSDGTVF